MRHGEPKADRAAVILHEEAVPLQAQCSREAADNLGKTPDLVSTDIEGLDYAVIKSLDLSKYRPGVICAEGVPMSEDNKPSDLVTYLTAQGYVVRGGSMVNTIFVDGRRLKTA